MSRIDTIFSAARAEGRSVLMPFLTGGYPTLAATEASIPALEAAGAGIVEIGIPFSDPIADGPVIASSMHDALESGVTPRAVFDVVERVRPRTGLGLLAMVSWSIPARMGPDRFLDDAARVGFDGLILPDIDLAEAEGIAERAADRGLAVGLLVADTTSDERLAAITASCRGFVYLLARSGLTGESDQLPRVQTLVERVRRVTDLPLAVGFGVSSRRHVEAVTRVADAAIVGSALVRRMGESDTPVETAAAFVRELAEGLATRAARS